MYYNSVLNAQTALSGHKRKDSSRRIAKIHGHAHGIVRMLDEGRSYSEIVHQTSAVHSSLDSVIQVIVDDLVEDSVGKAAAKEPVNESLEDPRRIAAAVE